MTTAIARFKSHFTHWREWELNPIVIKELRQAVRSLTVPGMLFLFLVVLFITSLGFLVTQSFDINANQQLGGTMFSAFMVILAVASVCFIPLYIGVRVAAERQENNSDLLYVSTLSPGRIIRGKFFCGAYMALLFFSACMPFMAFTNLLRGVDLPTVFYILFYLFLVVCAANMIAIFLACLPVSRPFKILFVLYGIFQSISIIGTLIGTSFMFMRSGIGAAMAGRDFWLGVVTFIALGAAVTGLFYVLSVALISPQSANRARPVRAYITILWLLGGVLNACWAWKTSQPDMILIWLFGTFGLMVFALLVTISNADTLSLRVRHTIPAAGLKKFCAFLFFNGAAGGLIWIALLSLMTFLGTMQFFALCPSRMGYPAASGDFNKLLFFSIITAYAFAYSMTGLFLHRQFLSKRPPKLAGLLAVLLAGAWALMPGIILFFTNQLSWKSVEGLQLGNIFNVFSSSRDEGQLHSHLIFAFAWVVLVMALNARWFARQVKNFKPPVRVTAENSPPVLK